MVLTQLKVKRFLLMYVLYDQFSIAFGRNVQIFASEFRLLYQPCVVIYLPDYNLFCHKLKSHGTSVVSVMSIAFEYQSFDTISKFGLYVSCSLPVNIRALIPFSSLDLRKD